jgi:LysR family transcriptional regulator, regulator of abg operon
MAPPQWTQSPIAGRLLTTIPVKEELSAPPIIVVNRTDVPLVPAADFLLDLMKRTAGHRPPADSR